MSAVTFICGFAASGSVALGQSFTAPAGIPSDTAPGGGSDDGSSDQKRQRMPAFSSDVDLATGSVRRSRWSGIHRPVSRKPNE